MPNTTKGFDSGYSFPSTVTCLSSIASRSADCVFGDALLISSASTMFANIGPGLKLKTACFGLNTLMPTMSEGRRSGRNWIRLNEHPIEDANAFAKYVFASPGTPSRRT